MAKKIKHVVKKTKKRSEKKSIHNARRENKIIIEFCKRCGSIMIPIKKGNTTMLKCRSCSYQTKKKIKNLKLVGEEIVKKKEVIILEKDTTMLPITDQVCPSCEHKKAYWWMQQTRASDEPPTQFFRCVKCRHVWREYK